MKPKLIHSFVWLIMFVFWTMVYANNNSIQEAMFKSFLLNSFYAFLFYSASKCQRFFYEKRNIWTLLGAFVLLLGIGMLFFSFIAFLLNKYTSTELLLDNQFKGIFRIVLLILLGAIYQIAMQEQKVNHQKKEVLLEKQKTELDFLKMQMNPHFFFNTLNNLYGLTYNKDDKAPEVVLMLSSAMRYMIYETQSNMVPLQKEIDFIENYIQLEKLRLVNSKNVNITIAVENSSTKIAPLILLPFIENCFKHSDIGKNKSATIDFTIWQEDGILNFSCNNTFNNYQPYKTGGIGTQNVKKRLNLVYGNNYELEIQKENHIFYVFLKLPLSL